MKIPVALLFCLVAACAPAALPEVSRARKVAPQCEGAAENRYFGAAELQLPPNRSKVETTAPVSKTLDAMREPSLSCGAGSNSYRVVWIHSFSDFPPKVSRYPPTAVRISEKNGTWTVTGVQLASIANRTELARNERTLAESESREVLDAVAEFGLSRRKDYAETDAYDGEVWIVEARHDDGYQAAFLANSDREACRKLARAFLKAAGINPTVLNGRE